MAFRYGGDSTDHGKAITRDIAGNIIIAGSFSRTADFDSAAGIHSLTANGGTDIFVAKYNPGGLYLWAISIGGAGADAASAVKTDEAGNIYVCGYFSGQADFNPGAEIAVRNSNGMTDAFIAKYDPNGNFVWANTFGSDTLDEAKDIVIDPASNVYCTGYFQHTIDIDPGIGIASLASEGLKDCFLVKYNSDGIYQWSVPSGAAGNDEGETIALDSDVNCYLGGFITPIEQKKLNQVAGMLGPGANTHVILSKYSTSGVLTWSKILVGSGFNYTAPGCLSISEVGDIDLAGCFGDSLDLNPLFSQTAIIRSNGLSDVFVAKYTLDGVYQKGFSFGGSYADIATAISTNAYGDFVITGSFKGGVDFDPSVNTYSVTSKGTSGASDIFIAKYSSQSDLFWVNTIGATTSTSTDLSVASSVVFDGLDNCYITGSFYRTTDFDPTTNILNLVSAGSSDIFVTEYDASGHLSLGEYPDIEISLANLEFGVVAVDSAKPLDIGIASQGTIDLAVTSVTSTNPRFTASPSSFILAPGNTRDITINFTPTDTLPQTGWIIIQHNASLGRDSIAVVGSGTLAIRHVDYQMAAGWNMISLPIQIPDASKNYLFSSSVSDAYFFTGSSYQTQDTIEKSLGYWLKFDSSRQFSRFGVPIMDDTLYVTTGWNLIGSVYAAVAVDDIIQDPAENVQSSYFEYDAGYKTATSIIPGKAYWVKAKESGRLILHAP